MIINYIQEILQKERQKGVNELYLRSVIKEYLQIIVLNFIYTNKEYKSNLIFTGGTCLRHLYAIERLSEDLDFDLINEINTEKLVSDIQIYFKSKLLYNDLQISIKQNGKQVLLKFPILEELNLATKSDSNLLYLKLDLSQIQTKSYTLEKTTLSKFGYNLIVLHYDLPSLFAGKINAILTRNLLVGKNDKQTIKGRDFYDLLWYLKKGVKVNIPLLKEKLNDTNLTTSKLQEQITDKVTLACTTYKTDFKNDLLPFIKSGEFIEDYINNYLEEYNRYKI